MLKAYFIKVRACISTGLTMTVILFSSFQSAQGLPISEEADSESMQVRIYLPMLFNVAAVTGGMQPYTGPPPDNPTWLEEINYFRSLAGLPEVVDDSDWSQGDWLHSRYMVKNDLISHSEDPSKPWFSNEGDLAARSSNLLVSSSHTATDLKAIAGWMQAPFHGLGMLDPQLRRVGYGSYRELDGGFQMGAALDVLRGLQDLPDAVTFPIVWPGDGTQVPLIAHSGEYPNPLSSCPGYIAPAGLPLILQIGAGDLSPQVTAHSFMSGNEALAHCVFDESSYTNPDHSAQSLGRAILDSRDAIVIIPMEPLTPGRNYSISVTVNGETHRWSFSTTAETTTTKSWLMDDGAYWEFSQH